MSCADAARSSEVRAASQVEEVMSGEVPPQQQREQAEATRGAAQPHLKEERYVDECMYIKLVHFYPCCSTVMNNYNV